MLKKEYWTRFSKDMEHDLYGGQKKIWNILRNRKRPINEFIQMSTINKNEQVNYFKKLYEPSADTIDAGNEKNNEKRVDVINDITRDDVRLAIFET